MYMLPKPSTHEISGIHLKVKSPRLPTPPTEEEIIKAEKDLQEMWWFHHGHGEGTLPPKRRR